MSDRRLRQGHHEPRNLWQHYTTEAPASKSGECVGQVFDPDLAAEICTAVNARRAAAGQPAADAVRAAVLATLQRMHPDVRPQGTGDALTLTEDAREITEAVMGAVGAELEQARALIRDLADDEPCSHFDHHGYCQTHGWLETDPPCPHGRAQQLAEEAPGDG